MSVPRKLFLMATGVLVLALQSPAQASPTASTKYTITGTDVRIYNLVGSLEVVRGDGSSVVAEVTVTGKDADRLKIVNGPLDGRQTLRVIYPGDRIIVPAFGDHTTSTFRINEDGTFRDENSGGRRITLTGRGSGVEAGADIRLSIPDGKKVSVYWGHGEASVTRVDADLLLDGAGMPVSATGIKGALRVDIGSGHVQVKDANAEISIDTGSGEVSLAGIHGSSIAVDTGSGEVTGVDIAVKTVSIETGSGEIHVDKLSGASVSLETGSGEVTAVISGDPQTLEVDSGSGDVSVTIPKSMGAELSIQTGSGGIETNLTMETRIRKHDELIGRIGDGSGKISIETGSGTVSLRQSGM